VCRKRDPNAGGITIMPSAIDGQIKSATFQLLREQAGP
jgi:hypothetical protein